jgi:integrase
MECVRLRVKDVDFAQHQIVVRDAKGEQDRVTVLPDSLVAPLQEHLQRVKQLHEKDADAGHGTVTCPMRSTANIRMPTASGRRGNTSSLRSGYPPTRVQAARIATT